MFAQFEFGDSGFERDAAIQNLYNENINVRFAFAAVSSEPSLKQVGFFQLPWPIHVLSLH